jgi:hypothetical protein
VSKREGVGDKLEKKKKFKLVPNKDLTNKILKSKFNNTNQTKFSECITLPVEESRGPGSVHIVIR